MKKIISIFLIVVLSISICGCSISKNSSTEPEATEEYTRDGYEYADFERFNSYAKDNGLDGTEVFVEGTVKSVSDFNDLCVLSVITEDNGRWLCSFIDLEYSEEVEKIFDEQGVVCFGKYRGFSDIFLMPSIFLDKIELGNKIYTAENLKKLQEPTTEEQATTEQPTTQKATEPTTQKPTDITDPMTLLYEDSEIAIYCSDIESGGYFSLDKVNVHLFVENKMDKSITIQADTVILDGISYNNVICSDPISSNTKGMIEITVMDCDNTSPSTVGADLRYFDTDTYDNEVELKIKSHSIK